MSAPNPEAVAIPVKLEPGEKGTVRVTYRANIGRKFNEKIVILAGEQKVTFFLTGVVESRVFAFHGKLGFKVRRGETDCYRDFVVEPGNKQLKINKVSVPSWLKVTQLRPLKGKTWEAYEFKVAVVPQLRQPGRLKGAVVFETSSGKASVPVELELLPELYTTLESFVIYQEGKEQMKYWRSVGIESTLGGFGIKRVIAPEFATVRLTRASKNAFQLTATLKDDAPAGNGKGVVRVETDSKYAPTIEIPILYYKGGPAKVAVWRGVLRGGCAVVTAGAAGLLVHDAWVRRKRSS